MIQESEPHRLDWRKTADRAVSSGQRAFWWFALPRRMCPGGGKTRICGRKIPPDKENTTGWRAGSHSNYRYGSQEISLCNVGRIGGDGQSSPNRDFGAARIEQNDSNSVVSCFGSPRRTRRNNVPGRDYSSFRCLPATPGRNFRINTWTRNAFSVANDETDSPEGPRARRDRSASPRSRRPRTEPGSIRRRPGDRWRGN